MRLRAVVVRRGQEDDDLTKRAALLRRDSVHGSFKGTIRVLKNLNTLVVNSNPIKFIYANSPSERQSLSHSWRFWGAGSPLRMEKQNSDLEWLVTK